MSASEATFYVTGGTLRHDAPSYVERQADKDLLDGLLKSEFSYVLTSRQMGKSSLMVRTAGKLREQGVHVGVLDLTAIGQNLTPEQWYDGLLVRMGRQLRLEDELEDFWNTHRQLGPCQRLFAAIHDVLLRHGVPALAGSSGGQAPPAEAGTPNAALVIFVDELDVVRSLPFSTDEFFAAIRECYTRRAEDPEFQRLTFCLLGVATPSDLIRDTRLTPFNIGRRIVLNDFTAEEAAPLAKGLPNAECGMRSAESLLQRILYWTNGHPYLTQRLCRAVAERARRRPPEGRVPGGPDQESAEDQGLAEFVPPKEEVDALCGELFFSNRAREQDDNLLFVRERLLRSEADVASLLHLYKEVRGGKRVRDDETNPLVGALRLSGVTSAPDGCLEIRNRIYERVFDHGWIRTNMPDAEVRRQKAAFWHGVARMGAVGAVVLAVVTALAVYAIRQKGLAEARKRLAEAHLYLADMEVAQQAWDGGNFTRAKELVETHRHELSDLRGFEWRYLWKLSRGDDEYVLGEHDHIPYDITFSPDGRTVAARSGDNVLKVWDSATRQCRFTLLDAWRGPIFFSDGKSMLVAGQTQVRLVDVATGQVTPVLEDAGQLVSLLDDGRTVVTTDTNHVVRLWDLPTGLERLSIPGAGLTLNVCVTRDGKRTAVIEERRGYQDEGITVWNMGAQLSVIKLPDQRRLAVMRFSPNGRQLAVGDRAGKLKVWNLDSTNEPALVRAHSSVVRDVAFSPDGRNMATCASDQTIKLWNLSDDDAPRHYGTLRGHEGPIHALCFSPDGTRLASGGRDKKIRIWKLDRIQGIDLAPGIFDHGSDDPSLYFLPDSKTLVGNSANGVKIWDTDRMQLRAVLPGRDLLWRVTDDGKGIHTTVTNAAGERPFRLWDIQTRTLVKEWPRAGMLPVAQKVVSSPDGQIIVLGNSRGAIQFWDALGWRELALRTNHTGLIRSLIFSRDGSTLFSSSNDGTVQIWDMNTLQTMGALTVTTLILLDLALSPDEQMLAVGSEDTRIYLWDWRRRKLLATLKGHRQTVISLDFSPDGRTLASGSSDGTVKLWNVALRREIATLRLELNGEPLQESVVYVGFSPDGNILAACTYEGTLKVWRAASWEEIRAVEVAKKP